MFKIYLGAIALSNVVRGLHIVCLGWIAMSLSGQLVAVGRVFLVAHLLSLIAGPFIGVLVDRYDRKLLLMIGQSVNFGSMLLPLAIVLSGRHLQMTHLYVLSILVGLASISMAGSFAAIMQTLVPPEGRVRAAALTGGVSQAAMAAGAGLGGFAITLLSGPGAFALGALCALLTVLTVSILPRKVPGQSTARGLSFFADAMAGLGVFRSRPAIAVLGLLTALGFSVGQASNALLPGFIQKDMGLDSHVYGLVDGGWAIGGFLAAFLVSHLAHRRRFGVMSVGGLGMGLGLLTAAFSLCTTPNLLVIVHLLMGGAFAAGKVVSDGLTLKLCPEAVVGRVRTTQQMMISLFGVVIYSAPGLFDISSAKTAYLTWGFCVAIVACLLTGLSLAMKRRRERQPAGSA